MASDLGSVNMLTEMGISPNVPAGQMLATVILFTLLYGVLGVMWYILMKRYAVEASTRPRPRRLRTKLRPTCPSATERNTDHDSVYPVVRSHRRSVDGLPDPRGFDFGVGMLLPSSPRVTVNARRPCARSASLGR